MTLSTVRVVKMTLQAFGALMGLTASICVVSELSYTGQPLIGPWGQGDGEGQLHDTHKAAARSGLVPPTHML